MIFCCCNSLNVDFSLLASQKSIKIHVKTLSTPCHPIGHQCWATAHTSWLWFTSPATCMTHPQLHSFPGLLISQMVPSALILGFYEKSQQKTNPERTGFIFLFVIEKRHLAESNWRLLKKKTFILAVFSTYYMAWLGFFFFLFLFSWPPLHIYPCLSQFGNTEFLNGDAHCTLKTVPLRILCIFIGLICMMDLSGSSNE